jgi:alpha-ketoglutarate-dependent taurine dioxygenase
MMGSNMAIEVTPLRPTLGAGVRGADLTRPVPPEVFAEIEAAFNRYAVLVFPGQPVSDEQQPAFSPLFGPLEVNPNYAGAKMGACAPTLPTFRTSTPRDGRSRATTAATSLTDIPRIPGSCEATIAPSGGLGNDESRTACVADGRIGQLTAPRR